MNNSDIITRIKTFTLTHKRILIPVAVFLLFLLFLSGIFSVKQSPSSSPTPNEQQIVVPTRSEEAGESTEGSELVENPDTLPDFQKKETFADGTIHYTYKSGNPSRPNIKITSGAGETLFTRTLNSKELPLASVSIYQEAYGDPERVIQGSKVYGQRAGTYIYASIGLAIIADPSGNAYEEHLFPPMSVDEYLQRYGKAN